MSAFDPKRTSANSYWLGSDRLAELRHAWDEFTAQGGVTVDDLKAFLRAEKIGTPKVVRRKHLRLVRSSKPIGGNQAH